MAFAVLPALPGVARAGADEIPVSTALSNKLSFGGEASLTRTAVAGDDVYAVWQDRTIAGTAAADIAFRHSTDRGTSFGGLKNLSRSPFQDSRHPEIAASGDHVYVVWQEVSAPTEPASQDQTWFAASDDRGATFTAAHRLDTGATSVVDPQVVADGLRVVVAWSASDGSVRSVASEDGGHVFSPPLHLGDGQWGAAVPSLAIQGSHVVAVWTTNTAEGVESAASDNGGFAFSQAVQVAAGDRVIPVVAMDEAGVAVAAWFARTSNSDGTLETATSTDSGGTWGAASAVAPILLAPLHIAESNGAFLVSASVRGNNTQAQAVFSGYEGSGFTQQALYSGAKEIDLAAAVPDDTDQPVARFGWTMPDRYGVDRDGNGVIDQPQTSAYLDPTSYRVDFDACRSTSSAAITTWAWTVDGVEQPAAASCRFSHDFPKQGLQQVTLRVTDDKGRTATVSHAVDVKDLLVVSLGDSVASGEGNPEGPSPTNPAWTDLRCHRSTLAGPSQAALRLERRDPATSVTFLSLACSGASVLGADTAHGGLLTPYDGQQAPSGVAPLPPQVDQLKSLLRQPDGTYRHIDALLLSIGANDVHFSDVLQNCIVQLFCYQGSNLTTLNDLLSYLPEHYAQLNDALKGLVDPGNVFITQYFDPTTDSSGAWNLSCLLDQQGVITATEAKWAGSYVVPTLNSAVHAAAQKYGWHDVAGLAEGFKGHGYCADDPWIVQIAESLLVEGRPDGAFHPNRAGHVFYGQQIAGVVQTALEQQAQADTSAGGTGYDGRGDLYVGVYGTDGTVKTYPYSVYGSSLQPGPAVLVAKGVTTMGGSLRLRASDRTAFAVWSDLTSPSLVNGAVEAFGGRAAYPAPDLQVIRAQAVQNVADPSVLIAGKSTTLRALVANDFQSAQRVAVRLRTTTVHRDGSSTDAVTETAAQVPQGVTWVDLPADAPMTVAKDAESVRTTVTVDPDNALAESDENDNTATVEDQVSSSRVLKVLYVPAGSASAMGQCADVGSTESASADYVTATFPVADADSHQRASCESRVVTTQDQAGVEAALSQLDALARSDGYDAAVGVVPSGWLQKATGTTAAGVALLGSSEPSGVPGAGALVEAGNGGALTAHELGHLFGLEHSSGVAAPGYWPARRQPQDDAVDFMSPSVSAKPWISAATSASLLRRLQLTPGDPAVIEVRGVIRPDGTVSAPAWYRQQGIQDVPLDADGALTLQYLDGSGAVLASTGLAVQDSEGAGLPPGAAPTGGYTAFDARVPDVPGATELKLLQGSAVLVDRHISTAAPVVHLTAPTAGTVLTPGQNLTVTWTATDADSSSLTSQLDVSTDSGATWAPLARDVTGTSYTLPVTRTLTGSHVRFRVVTSDGVNTGSAANAADLTVATPSGNGRIAYTHAWQYNQWPNTTYGPAETWVMNADGSNAHKVADGYAPRLWDPAGGSLVSLANGTLTWLDVDTGKTRSIPAELPPSATNPIAACPTFSPDGGRLAFKATTPSGSAGIYTVGADGKGLLLVADGVNGCPTWSSGGIAFPEPTSSGNAIAVVAPDGTGRKVLEPVSGGVGDLAYSPDGQQLVYYNFSDYRVHVVNADGSGDKKLYPSSGYTYQVGWSPDGKKLLVQWWNYGYTYMIGTMNPDGTGLTALTHDDPSNPNAYAQDSGASWETLGRTTPPPPAAPAADAGGPYTVDQGQPVTLDASGSATAGDVPSFEWDLDGDGSYDATGVTTTTVFRTAGTHTVGLRVTHPDGTTATDSATVTVKAVAPRVTLPSSVDGAVGIPVQLLGATVTDDGTAPPQVFVDWGDGTGSTTASLGQLVDGRYNVVANHTFTSPGSYTVTVAGFGGAGEGPELTVPATISGDASPQVSAVTPTDVPASGGTTTRLLGSRLATTTSVTVGGAAATFVAVGDSALDITVPPGAAGDAPLLVTTPAGTATTSLRYVSTTAPRATDLHAETAEGSPVGLRLQGSGSGGWLHFATTSQPAHGGLEQLLPDTVLYTPRAGFVGTDTFTYVASDADGTSTPATVTVRVGNHPPVVDPDLDATGSAGQPLVVAAREVLAHASDADGDTLHVVGAYLDPTSTAQLTFDSGTGAFTVVQPAPGKTPVDVLVTDGRSEPVHTTMTLTFTGQTSEAFGLRSVTMSARGTTVDAAADKSATVLSNGAVALTGVTVQGDVISTQDSVTLGKATTVTGKVTAGTTITNSSGNAIDTHPQTPTSVMTAHAVAACSPYQAAPTASAPWISGKYTYDAKTGALAVTGDATLASGTYCLGSVSVSGGSQLSLKGGHVVLHLTGRLAVSGGSVGNAGGPAVDLQVATSYTGTDGVALSGGSVTYGLVYAPGTSVTVSGRAQLFGAALGDTLVMSGGSQLHCDSDPASLTAWGAYLAGGT